MKAVALILLVLFALLALAATAPDPESKVDCGGQYPDQYACWYNNPSKRDQQAAERGWYYKCSYKKWLGRCYCCALSSSHNPKC